MRFRHPSMAKLQAWLDTGPGEGDGRLDAHIESCAHCTERLESRPQETAGDVRSALMATLASPDGLEARLSESIHDRMAARGDLRLITELFGVPLRTAKIMANPRGEKS